MIGTREGLDAARVRGRASGRSAVVDEKILRMVLLWARMGHGMNRSSIARERLDAVGATTLAPTLQALAPPRGY